MKTLKDPYFWMTYLPAGVLAFVGCCNLAPFILN